MERTSEKLRALEARVRAGSLVDPAKIGRSAQRILGGSGVGRLFDVEVTKGRFLWHYRDAALDYEETLAGRYVPVTSLTPRGGIHRCRHDGLPPAPRGRPTAGSSTPASGISR